MKSSFIYLKAALRLAKLLPAVILFLIAGTFEVKACPMGTFDNNSACAFELEYHFECPPGTPVAASPRTVNVPAFGSATAHAGQPCPCEITEVYLVQSPPHPTYQLTPGIVETIELPGGCVVDYFWTAGNPLHIDFTP